MTAKPITTWAACARCVNGDATGTTCRAPQLRAHGMPAAQPTAQVRVVGCGLQAAWHVYRPATEGAPAMVAA